MANNTQQPNTSPRVPEDDTLPTAVDYAHRLLGSEAIDPLVCDETNVVLDKVRTEISHCLRLYEDPEYIKNNGQPYISKDSETYVLGGSPIPEDILLNYARLIMLKARHKGGECYYNLQFDKFMVMDGRNFRTLYDSKYIENPLHVMLSYEINNGESNRSALRASSAVISRRYGVNNVTELFGNEQLQEDIPMQSLKTALQHGIVQPNTLYDTVARLDGRVILHSGTPGNRAVMRQIVIAASGVSPELADKYIFHASRATMGAYALNDIVSRIKSFGAEKLSKNTNILEL